MKEKISKSLIIKHLISFLRDTQVEVLNLHREGGRYKIQVMSKLKMNDKKELARRSDMDGCSRQLAPKPGSNKESCRILHIEKKLNLTRTERLGVIVRCDWKRRQQLGGGVQVL